MKAKRSVGDVSKPAAKRGRPSKVPFIDEGAVPKGSAAKVFETSVILFDEWPIRMIPATRDQPLLFVISDLKGFIGRNLSVAVAALDAEEKGICLCYTLGGPQRLLTVTESGLYTLALRANGATTTGTVQHRFRRWVTGEVLPQIRMTGGYAAPGTLVHRILNDSYAARLCEAVLSHRVGRFGLSLRHTDFLAEIDAALDAYADGVMHRASAPMSIVGRGRVDGLALSPDGDVTTGSFPTSIRMVTRGLADFESGGLDAVPRNRV
jgi:prophage antirepressor-like protein